MTARLARTALAFWGMDSADLALIATRENHVYRVHHGGRSFALRLHRPGYQTLAMISSELAWLDHLHASGLRVPTPLVTKTGQRLLTVGEHHVDLLTWLPGRPLGVTGTRLDATDRLGTFHNLGRLMAQIHAHSDRWTLPDEFDRHAWNLDGLLGQTPLWGRFWDNPGLGCDGRRKVLLARDRLATELGQMKLDYGLIHADMLGENILIDGTNLGVIDFDDSGFGHRVFDVATTLLKYRREPDYPDLQAALLAGYRDVRPLDTRVLPHFLVIRALSYLGWILPRRDEPGADARQTRFLAAALPMVESYLRLG